MQEYKTPIEEQIAKNKAMMGNTDFANKYGDILNKVGYDFDADKKQAQGLRLLQAGLGIMGGTSPFAAANIGQGSQAALAGYGEDIKGMKQQQMDLAKQQFELGKFGYSTNADLVKAAQTDRKSTLADLTKIYGSEKEAEARLKAAEIAAGATVTAAGISAEKAGAKDKAGIKIEYDALVAQGFDPNSPITMQKAQQQYFAATRPYGATQVASALGDRLAKDQELINLFKQQRTLEFTGTDAEKKALAEKIETRRKQVETDFNTQLGSARGGAANPAAPASPAAPAVPPLPPGFKPV
jgi:hypothetical protein